MTGTNHSNNSVNIGEISQDSHEGYTILYVGLIVSSLGLLLNTTAIFAISRYVVILYSLYILDFEAFSKIIDIFSGNP